MEAGAEAAESRAAQPEVLSSLLAGAGAVIAVSGTVGHGCEEFGEVAFGWLAAAGWLGMVRGDAAELYSHRRVVGVVVAY